MDLAKAVTVLVARVLPATVADGLVPVAPGRQAGIDAVLVGVDEGAFGDGGLDDRLDRLQFQARLSACIAAFILPSGCPILLLIVVAGNQTAALAVSFAPDPLS